MTGPESADGRRHLHGWPIRDYDELIATLAASRTSQDISQLQLARKLGVLQTSISAWLTGRTTCKRDHLFALADALGYGLALVKRDETGQVSASIQPQSDQNRPGVAEPTPDPQNGPEGSCTGEHFWHGAWCYGSGPEREQAEQTQEALCNCGHEGLDSWFHLKPCPIAEQRFAAIDQEDACADHDCTEHQESR